MKYVYPLLLLIVLLLSSLFKDYTLLVFALMAITLFKLMQKIGNGVALREMIAVYSCIIYLLMPLIGYRFYTSDYAPARLWVKYMPVNEEVYFGFVFPAITVFIFAMFLPSFGYRNEPDSNAAISPILKRAQDTLKNNNVWKPLLIMGVSGYFLRAIISISALAFFIYTFYLVLFAALLCIYFSPGLKYKRLIVSSIVLLIFYEAIQSGMFTVLVYMGIVIVSIIFIGTRIALWKKVTALVLAVLFIVALQTTKATFRGQTWSKEYQGSKTELFADLMQKNLSNFNTLFDKKNFFPIYTRMNQGFNTALVMRRIPAVQDFDNGTSIYLTVGSALLPRIIWSDKLESGGAYNMKHFAGWDIKGFSTNIGPVGEAYGNFGVLGGVIYMFFFGFFIRWAYFTVIRMSRKYSLLIFWIPVMFFEVSYSMENDTLQALNSLIKVAIFMWAIYKIAPKLFIGKKESLKTTNENSHYLRDNRPGWSLPGKISH